MADTIHLPAAYKLIVLQRLASLRDAAKDAAAEGAEEGTIMLADEVVRERGNFDRTWLGGRGDLHCSIILRPEFSAKQYPEILLVGVIAMANALAVKVSPLTALVHRWPHAINIAGHKVAALWLDASPRAADPWLSITAAVNIARSPPELVLAAISIAEAEGNSNLTASELLEEYARQFISTINHWADGGAQYLRKKWRTRAGRMGDELFLHERSRIIRGRNAGLNEKCDLTLETDGGGLTVALEDYVTLWQ